jgi:diadenosine tetraphosphate (Ap4A) HIT family hydrolase
MFFVAQKVAKKLWVLEGYKLAFNVWKKWWQEIMHIHMHLLSNI